MITVLPIYTINIMPIQMWVATNMKTVESYSKIADAVASIPGIGNIKQMITNLIKQHADALIKAAKAMIIAMLFAAMNEALALLPIEQFVKKLNKLITAVNKVLKGIEDAIDVLKTLLKPIFPILIVCTVAYVIARVITLIPTFGSGMGFVVSATMPGNIAGAVLPTCEKTMNQLKPIPAAVLATILQLISIFTFSLQLQFLLNKFYRKQTDMEQSAVTAAGKTADDWANSSESSSTLNEKYKNSKSINNKSNSLNASLLNNTIAGLEDNLNTDNNGLSLGSGFDANNEESAAAGILADNLIERVSIVNQINNINAELNGIGKQQNLDEDGNVIGDCKLPEGGGVTPEIVITTPLACEEQGGIFGYGSPPTNPPAPPTTPYTDESGTVWCWKEPPGEWEICGGTDFTPSLPSIDERNNLNLVKSGLETELANLGGELSAEELMAIPPELSEQISSVFDNLGNNIITSLLYSDPNATIEEATKNFGTRYGFYQQEINEEQ